MLKTPVPSFATRDFTLRLSVTDRCNYRCRYCAPPRPPFGSVLPLPPLSHLARIARFLVECFGVRRVKITGGEPLVRRGVVDLVAQISAESSVEEVTMTTNGSLLSKFATTLKSAGLRRVNVSLDTLDPARFALLCGGELNLTLQGIDAALEAGLSPVKVNSVLVKEWWKDDLPRLLDFAADRGLEVRFIELMPLGAAAQWSADRFVPATEVLDYLAGVAEIRFLPVEPGKAARRSLVQWKKGAVKVGWITPESESFCATCDRLRLDARGNLRRCLMDDRTLPLGDILKSADPDRVVEMLEEYVTGKTTPALMRSGNAMLALGG